MNKKKTDLAVFEECRLLWCTKNIKSLNFDWLTSKVISILPYYKLQCCNKSCR